MNYDNRTRTGRPDFRRLVTTILALCLPIIAATFFSGSFFKLGTLEPGEVLHVSSAHAASGHNAPNAVAISISNSAFNPSSVTIDPGTTVTWTNNSSDRRRVRDSAHNLFDSDDLNPGQSFSYTFNTPGTIQVVEERDDFTGTVIVRGTPPPPTSGTGTAGTAVTTGTAGTAVTTGTAVSTGTAQATTTPVSGQLVIVNIVDEDFPGYDPANVTIQSGTTVRWNNVSDDEHTVTSAGNWDSGEIEEGGTFQTTLIVNGTYNYFCAYHEDMAGSVTVVGGPSPTPQVSPTTATGTVNVSIQNFTYTPQNVSIQVGSTVRWTNNDSAPHTATSPGNFDSGNLGQGGTFQYTFNTPGTFTYLCAYHSGMTGTITVTNGGGGGTTTPQVTNTPQATSTPASGNVEVSIQNFTYSPQNVTIAAGATVRWTNNDTYAHTVTSPGNFDSGNMNQGQTWQYTFNTPGTYNYICAYHSNMTGTITVTGGGGSTTTPQTTAQASSTPQSTAQATATTVAGAVQVNIQNFAYSPQNVTVNPGTKVRWTNNDAYPHSVTSPGNFDSGNMNQGQSYEFTFNTPGTYTYICAYHGNMSGSVTVQQAGAPTNTPRPATNTPRPTNTPQPGQPTATHTPVPSDVTVDILNFAYAPATLTVRVGTTVHWPNRDNAPHSVTSLDTPPLFDSGVYNLNETWQYTFNTPGTYDYYCTVHGTFMSGTIIVEAAPTATPTMAAGQIFSDVRPADYFFEPVNWLVGQGIISGYADGTFRPYNNATRAQVTKMVVLSEGWTLMNPTQPTFTDVAPGTTFYSYIETGVEHGIISGYADDTFRPNNQVTRGQITKIVVLARGWEMSNPVSSTFSDVPVGSTFFRHVETAAAQGILGGYSDGTFRPGNNATRGQVAKILYNALLRP